MDANGLINKLLDSLNGLINQGYDDRIIESSNKLFETLKIIRNCTREYGCKINIKDNYFDEFNKSTNEIDDLIVKLEKEKIGKEDIINRLNNESIKINGELNRMILCKGCKIEKLMNKLV